jgi:NAD(P)-dependent dehydrogenase (short-subunit alcohol dehydrogenase family)
MGSVIVTGPSRGIGRYCADHLHASGPFEVRHADVSDHTSSFVSAVESLRCDRSVYALINVAGIASMNLLFTTRFAPFGVSAASRVDTGRRLTKCDR